MAVTLYPWQQRALPALVSALREHGAAADMSSTGTGKSYVAMAVAKEMRLRPFICCPKAIVPMWKGLSETLGVPILGAFTYEKLRTGNTEYVKKDRRDFKWNLPVDALVIFDEAHRGKSPTSQTSRLMAAAKDWHCLLLSATLAEGPSELRAAGYLLGLCDYAFHKWEKWVASFGYKKNPWGAWYCPKHQQDAAMTMLSMSLFPDRAHRVRISDIPEFPETQVTAQAFDVGDPKKIDEYLAEVECANGLVEQLRSRQKVEELKVPALIELAKDLMAEGHAVAVFVNFRATLDAIKTALKCPAIYGGQKPEERQAGIDAFQADEARAIVANIEAGGVGLSLHDVNGDFPRAALICPTFSAKSLVQVLGRVHRAGGKTKSLQRIVFAAGTIEERVRRRVEAKLHCLDLLNDGDLSTQETPPVVSSGESSPITLNEVAEPLSDERLHKPFQPDTPLEPALALPLPPTPALAAADRPPSPSALLALLNCPGFLNDDAAPGLAAEEGRRAHKACELEDPNYVADNERLRKAVELCLGYVRKIPARYVQREIKIPIFYGRNGYIDRLHDNGSEADLIDYKFARNFYQADGPQFWAYLVSLWENPQYRRFEKITVHVPHPFQGKIDVETFTQDEHYEKFKNQVNGLLSLAKLATAEHYRPTAHCAYCARAGRCPALISPLLEIASRYEKQALPQIPSGSMHGSDITDPNDFAALLPWAPVLEKAAEGWKHSALELALSQTVEIPGYRMVTQKGKRKIVAPAIALEELMAVGVTAEEFACVASVPVGELENLYASRAPKGKMGKWKQELSNKLRDRDALVEGKEYWKLVKET